MNRKKLPLRNPRLLIPEKKPAMTIIIFGDLFSFPEGHAATNRIYTYAKGLKENGVQVEVICFSNDYLDRPDGEAEGIPYYNAFNRVSRSPSFLPAAGIN